MRTKVASAVLAGALALLGTGCGGDDSAPADPPAGSTATASPQSTSSPAGGPERAPTAFNNEGTTGTFDCDGQDVTVNGDEVDLQLVGECGTVVVNGERAVVMVDDATLIVVNGEEARVTFAGDPEVTVTGEDATAEPAG